MSPTTARPTTLSTSTQVESLAPAARPVPVRGRPARLATTRQLRGAVLALLAVALLAVMAGPVAAQDRSGESRVFLGPGNGGPAAGVQNAAQTAYTYNGVVYPIVLGKVTFPDCTIYIAAANNLLLPAGVASGCSPVTSALPAPASGMKVYNVVLDEALTTLYITGSFRAEPTLTFNGAALAWTSANSSLIQTPLPIATPGTYKLVVTDSTNPAAYDVFEVAVGAGTVTSVTGTGAVSVATGSTTPVVSLGTVPVASGGTGLTSVGTSGQVLSSTGTAMAWSTLESGGTVTSVTGTAPISVATGTTTPAISVANATASAAGAMSATDKSKLDAFNASTTYAPVASPTFTGTVTAPTFAGNLTGAVTGSVTGNVSGTAANVTGTVAVANGGTGSTTQNFVGLSGDQTIAGTKTFSSAIAASITGSAASATTATTASTATTAAGLSATLAVGSGGTGTSTALTQGSVVIAGASGTYSADRANLFWDASNKRLGIGTATPAYKLDVAGDINLSGASAVYVQGVRSMRIHSPSANVLYGTNAGGSITTGTWNTGIGHDALNPLTTGLGNTGVGASVLSTLSTSSSYNTALGRYALFSLITGGSNTAVGYMAGYGTGDAASDLQYGSYNLYLGAGSTPSSHGTSGTPLTNEIVIGGRASGGGSNSTVIGTAETAKTVIAGIYGATLSGTTWSVVIDANGRLGSVEGGGGAVTSVAALTLGTSGTDLASSVANGTSTPVITLNVPTASASNRGALSAADWTSFNGKESALTFSTPLSRSSNTISLGTVPVANGGTGSTTQNFVGLSGDQTIAGTKTFSSTIAGNISGSAATATTAAGLSATLAVANGGTGLSTLGAAGTVLTVSGGAASWRVPTLTSDARRNTSGGSEALTALTTGQNNVAMGDAALKLISIADGNTAVGASAGASLTGGSNTAIGWNAMAGGQGSTGDTNTAVGGSALRGLTSGKENVALGNSALLGNTGASQNIAIGAAALWHQVYERPGQASYNTQNIAIGEMALGNTNPTAVDFFDNATNGASNVGVGHYALQDNTTGFGNVALGNNSGLVNTTGNYNIHLGDSAKASGQAVSNEIVIGHGATGLGSNSTLIGNSSTTKAYIKGISGVTSTGGVAVYVNSDGQLGTVSSSRRFKENIQDMAGASSRIFNLRPVTFNYKAAYGGGGTQFGLIAEEVDQVIPEMTVRDKDGQIETVAYQLLPPMLLNEAQKQHKAIEMLQADNSTLKAEVDTLKAQVAAILARLPR